MPEVSLSRILAARDRRVELQKRLIKTYGKPIISFTMNIAGPCKTSPLIERAFREGIKMLLSQLPNERVADHSIHTEDTGCEAFFSVDMAPAGLKQICTSIEDSTPLGRLFDMDVIDTSGEKLNRRNARGCIVCGAEGRACAAGRRHSVEDIVAATEKIICDHFLQNDRELITELAVQSLVKEVRTTPKPGLVDQNNSGSHTDMNMESFIKSAYALRSYFATCFDIGKTTQTIPPDEVFLFLKSAGIRAEEAMYTATGGVNTHKGVVYSMGIICGSIGRLWTPERPIIGIAEITETCSLLSASMIERDLAGIDDSTAGGKYYRLLGITGIRGEVLSGFSSVTEIALPTYIEALSSGYTENDAGVLTLIRLISRIKDTNLYHRGGPQGAEYASRYAEMIINKLPHFSLNEIDQMDREFIKRNLSPGGCADLLAITYFFHGIIGYNF